MNVIDLPFNQYLGLRSSGEGVEISLVPEPQHLNHLETLHATVLYGLAEAACGQEILTRFPRLTEEYMVVLRGSSVKYRQPGRNCEVCVAFGSLDDGKAEAFQSHLETRGRAILDVEASVRQSENILLTGTFSWFVTKMKNIS